MLNYQGVKQDRAPAPFKPSIPVPLKQGHQLLFQGNVED
jgi:hypothetical protein